MTSEDQPSRAVTLRALAVGLLLVVVADLWCIHAETLARTSSVNLQQFPVSLAAPFALLVLVVNPGLSALRRTWALTRAELLVALAMGLVGAVIPMFGVTGYFLGLLSTPFYYASPENQWDLYFLDHIPLWLAPRNTGSGLAYFFEGIPPGVSIPWGVWLVPLFWWGTLIAAVVAFSLGIAVVLRRPWAEHQRLVYPLLTPAVTLTDGIGPGARWADVVRTRLFWAGFAVAFGIDVWNYFSAIFPVILSLPRVIWPGQWFYLSRHMPPLWTYFNLYTFGFGYFTHLDILLGFWALNLFLTAEIGLFRRVGYQIGGDVGILGYVGQAGAWGDPETAWQCFGALTVLVLWGLYVTRRHLIEVVRKALRPGHSLDDAGEMLSSRAAVCCVVVGLAYTLCWLHAAGLELRMLIPFLFALLIVYIGLARFAAEAGVLFIYSPMSPQEFTVRLSGTATVSASSMTILTFAFVLRGSGQGFLMPVLTQAVRLGDLIQGKGRRLFVAMVLAVLVALTSSVFTTLYTGYTHGAANFRDYGLRHSPRLFDRTLSLIKSYTKTDPQRLMFFGIGGGIMAVLSYLRYRLPWWPIHPIGFPIAGTDARGSILSIVLIWGVKSILLRVGGAALYRRGVPFFIGIIVGHAVAVFLGYLVDQVWFPGQGHFLHGE